MMQLVETFSALGDRTRFAIVERLIVRGECNAGALQDVAELSAPAMSRHLKVLREAGLIRQRVQGTHRYYSVDPEAMQAISAWTMSHREFWEGSLARLEALMKPEEE